MRRSFVQGPRSGSVKGSRCGSRGLREPGRGLSVPYARPWGAAVESREEVESEEEVESGWGGRAVRAGRPELPGRASSALAAAAFLHGLVPPSTVLWPGKKAENLHPTLAHADLRQWCPELRGPSGQEEGRLVRAEPGPLSERPASVSHSVTHGHRSPGNRLTARGIDGHR